VSDFLVAVIAGVVTAVVWTLVGWAVRWVQLKRHFAPLAGRYRVSTKWTKQPRDDSVSISVRANVLNVQYEQPQAPAATGLIEMHEKLRTTGKGHYSHLEGAGWGVWDVQVVDVDTILVDTTYTNPNQLGEIVQGYEWSRVGPGPSVWAIWKPGTTRCARTVRAGAGDPDRNDPPRQSD